MLLTEFYTPRRAQIRVGLRSCLPHGPARALSIDTTYQQSIVRSILTIGFSCSIRTPLKKGLPLSKRIDNLSGASMVAPLLYHDVYIDKFDFTSSIRKFRHLLGNLKTRETGFCKNIIAKSLTLNKLLRRQKHES